MKSSYDGITWYYEKFPEYTLEFLDDPENDRLRTPSFALMQMNARSSWQNLRLKFHQTILLEFSAHYIDETRGIAVHPKTAFLNLFDDYPISNYVNSYYYYLSSSPEIYLMKLLKILMDQDNSALYKHLNMIPVFDNLQQKEDVEKLINDRAEEYQEEVIKRKNKCHVGYNSKLSHEDIEYAKVDMATTVMVKETLKKYKTKNHLNIR